jgi:hypothetical protein
VVVAELPLVDRTQPQMVVQAAAVVGVDMKPRELHHHLVKEMMEGRELAEELELVEAELEQLALMLAQALMVETVYLLQSQEVL